MIYEAVFVNKEELRKRIQNLIIKYRVMGYHEGRRNGVMQGREVERINHENELRREKIENFRIGMIFGILATAVFAVIISLF